MWSLSIANKRVTINRKYEKDNKCVQWSTTSGLSYNKIKKKYLKKIEKFKRVDIDLSSYQRNWGEFEQNITSTALNVLLVSYSNEKIKLAYKSRYNNKRKKKKKKKKLLIVNDEANNYYFAVKNFRIKFF